MTARPSVAIVDLEALRKNVSVLRGIHGGRMLAVLKANAYGHGAVRCAQALKGVADGLAVAFLAEALALRSAGSKARSSCWRAPSARRRFALPPSRRCGL